MAAFSLLILSHGERNSSRPLGWLRYQCHDVRVVSINLVQQSSAPHTPDDSKCKQGRAGIGSWMIWAAFYELLVHVDFRADQKRLASIDYRCADGLFLMSPRGMAVSNTSYLSSSETRVDAGVWGWKLHLSESTYWCQESVGGICFTNKWRAASLHPLKSSNHC